MKRASLKLFIFTLITVLAFGLIIMPQAVKSEAVTSLNLVNGDFETGNIAGWTWSSFSTNGTDVSSKIVMGSRPVYPRWYGKTNSLVDMGYCKTAITVDEAYTLGSLVYQEKDVSQYLPGSTLTFSADMLVWDGQRGPVGDKGGLTLEYYDKDGKLIKTDETGPIGTSPSGSPWDGLWRSKAVSSQIPEGAATVRAELKAYVGTPNWIDAYFDNAMLTITLPVDTPTIDIQKTVKGTPGASEAFTFELIPGQDIFPMPEGSDGGLKTVVIEGSGTASLGTWSYTKPGTYTYQVQEVTGSNMNYSYDKAVYTITDTVILNDAGDLELSRSVQDSSGEAVEGTLIFTNEFTAKPVTPEAIGIQKIVKGTPYTDETFTFELTPGEDTFPMPAASDGKQEITIKGAGVGTFGTWTYTAAGVYTYQLKEVAGSNEDYTYDKTVYTITDTVTLNDAGNLEASRAIQNENGASCDRTVTFTNQYKPHEEFPNIEKPDPPTNPDNSSKPNHPNVDAAVQTGDYSQPVIMVIIFGLSALILLLLALKSTDKRRR